MASPRQDAHILTFAKRQTVWSRAIPVADPISGVRRPEILVSSIATSTQEQHSPDGRRKIIQIAHWKFLN